MCYPNTWYVEYSQHGVEAYFVSTPVHQVEYPQQTIFSMGALYKACSAQVRLSTEYLIKQLVCKAAHAQSL